MLYPLPSFIIVHVHVACAYSTKVNFEYLIIFLHYCVNINQNYVKICTHCKLLEIKYLLLLL